MAAVQPTPQPTPQRFAALGDGHDVRIEAVDAPMPDGLFGS